MLHRPQVRDLLRSQALDAPPPRDFAGALRRDDGTDRRWWRRSSAGRRRRATSLPTSTTVATAAAYAVGGAACLSVLTDRPYFGGTVDDLARRARGALRSRCCARTSRSTRSRSFEARAIGADAVLLIVAALPDDAHLARSPRARRPSSASACSSRRTTAPSSSARSRPARRSSASTRATSAPSPRTSGSASAWPRASRPR